MSTEAYVYDNIRTPFGRFRGGLSEVRPDDLATHVVKTLVERAPQLDPARIDGVVFGNANGAGEENRNVARMATLLAGLPVTVPGTTMNRLCGSSMDAAMAASREVLVGDADLVLVGGVESMTRAPWVMLKPSKSYPPGDVQLASTTLGWRLVNKKMPPLWASSLGESTEMLREKFGIDREQQDEFALRSHQLAAQAWEDGFYDDHVVAVPETDLNRDESVRFDASLESLAKLKPSFRKVNGTVTAGNASPLTDGASAMFIGSAKASELLGQQPLARICGRGVAAVEPQMFGIAPVEAANRALAQAGISWDEIGVVELNEAFAAQSLACLGQWPIDPKIVNPNGGALAIGHPLGASGARLIATLARGMKAQGARYGVAAVCIGVGQGLAMVLENVEIGNA